MNYQQLQRLYIYLSLVFLYLLLCEAVTQQRNCKDNNIYINNSLTIIVEIDNGYHI